MKIAIAATTTAALWLSLVIPQVYAQEPFPSKLVTIINPNAPGGMSDIIARGMLDSLQRSFKQSVIAVGRVGAGGAVGGAFVAKAPADGYTTLLNTVTHVLIPITENALGRAAPYAIDDFTLIARVTADPLLLVAHTSLPVKTVGEFVALAKKRPGEITYASPGVYSSGHIAMALLARAAGINALHSPYNGAGPAMTAVLGGHVFLMYAPAGVVSPHINSGRVRLIAQTGPKRGSAFPQTPTLKEAGYDAELMLWAGYFAPAKTPPVVVRAWQAALREGSEDVRFKAAMAKINVTIDYLDGDALQVWYADELKRLDRDVRSLGKIEGR